MYNSLIGWARLPFHPSPWSQLSWASIQLSEESLGAGCARPVDKGTAPLTIPSATLDASLGDHVCENACPQTAGANCRSSQKSEGGPGVFSSPDIFVYIM